MCLDVVTSKRQREKKVGYGWKMFVKSGGKFHGECKNPTKERPVGIWLDEADFAPKRSYKRITSTIDDTLYPRGWHIYRSRTGYYGLTRVKYRGVLAEGKQNWDHIIIAKYMKIERKGKTRAATR